MGVKKQEEENDKPVAEDGSVDYRYIFLPLFIGDRADS